MLICIAAIQLKNRDLGETLAAFLDLNDAVFDVRLAGSLRKIFLRDDLTVVEPHHVICVRISRLEHHLGQGTGSTKGRHTRRQRRG